MPQAHDGTIPREFSVNSGLFVGRKWEIEALLARIHTALAQPNAAAAITGLQGQGGIGKTALAREVGARLGESFPDGQVFLDLNGYAEARAPLTPADFLAHVFSDFYPTARCPEELATLHREYLRALEGRRVLLVADNVAPHADLRLLLPPRGSLLLLTSREALPSLPGLNPLRLGELSEPDAIALLRRLCPRLERESDSVFQPLAEISGRLPLALETNASTLQLNPFFTIPDLCQELQGGQALVDPVRAAYRVSYDRLVSDELRQAWRQLAVFPADFDAAGAAAVWNCEPLTAKRLLGALDRASLLLRDESADRVRLHDLARLFASAQLDASGERAEVSRQHAVYYAGVIEALESLHLSDANGPVVALNLFKTERINIETGWRWVMQTAGADDPNPSTDSIGIPELRSSGPLAEEAFRLLVNCALSSPECISLRLSPLDHVKWIAAAVAAARRLDDRKVEGLALGNLSISWFSVDEPDKAIECSEQSRSIAQDLDDRLAERNALHNLGSAWRIKGDIDKAIDFYEQYLHFPMADDDPRARAKTLRNLGEAWIAKGSPKVALTYLQQSLVLSRGSGDPINECSALYDYARALWVLDQKARALDLIEESLRIHQETEDPFEPRVRMMRNQWRAQMNPDAGA